MPSAVHLSPAVRLTFRRGEAVKAESKIRIFY